VRRELARRQRRLSHACAAPNATSREGTPVLYMVIETYKRGPRAVYERAAERGRMLPAGLVYVDSWVDERSLER